MITLKQFLKSVQIRDRVVISVLDGEYKQKTEDSWVEFAGECKNIYKSKRGTDFKHRLKVDEIPEEYLDYEVYCISGDDKKYTVSVDIRRKNNL